MQYADVADAIAPTGMVARGGFVDEAADRPCTIVVIGNVGGAMWPAFRAGEPQGNDPLDTWTRAVLCPIAAELGADFVHPSDQPYQPFQRWAQRADAVWPSPLGLLIHAEYGLWHAYRGAFVFPFLLDSLPPVDDRRLAVRELCRAVVPARLPGRRLHRRWLRRARVS